VRQFAFPGFRVFQEDKELEIRRDEQTGQIILDISAGAGQIRLELTKLLPETAGEALSILSAAIALLLVLVEIRRRKVPT
jgi:hypothetical protein